MADRLIGTEMPNLSNRKTQVYMATHKSEEGGERLPLMYRSFISFSYGGKFIEDFGLIATISGDRLQKNLYANFEDDITTYEIVDGQYYWGTHFTNNNFNFVLSTDGITEAQLNEFRHWFKPGIERELVLAENPNRAIMARVAAVPSYSFIPFEEKITVNIEGFEYETSTTLYKGDINLSLVADEPFWYSRNIFIDYYYDKTAEDKFNPDNITHESSDNSAETVKDKDFLKVIVEDDIPYLSMLQSEVILSEGRYAKLTDVENNQSSIIGDESSTMAARIEGTIQPYTGIVGIVYGNSVTITSENPKYLYYSGTAPSKPIIQFTLTPELQDDYIIYPYNTYAQGPNQETYNILTIGSQVMKFTLPSILLGYNQAIAIINNEETVYVEEIRQNLIMGVNEYYSRAWAIKCLDETIAVDGNVIDGIIQNNFKNTFISLMKSFVYDTQTEACRSVSFTFNSKKGIAEGSFTVPYKNSNLSLTEKVGDMLRSDFITIVDRNYPKPNNYITNDECSVISTNYPGGLQNVLITFKNMYY